MQIQDAHDARSEVLTPNFRFMSNSQTKTEIRIPNNIPRESHARPLTNHMHVRPHPASQIFTSQKNRLHNKTDTQIRKPALSKREPRDRRTQKTLNNTIK